MRRVSFRLAIFSALTATLLVTRFANAQYGVSSLAYDSAASGMYFGPIQTEDLINLHLHEFPFPKSKEEPLKLDLQCGLLPNGRIAFQAGLAAIRSQKLDERRPVNLVLVIDRSGSMDGDRICKVKESLKLLLEKIKPADRVSVVSFSDEARVDLDWDNERNVSVVNQSIERIQANGSTNLHAGLMLGYEQAVRKYDPKRSNHIVLLTDGLANVGVTATKKIAADSREFNQQGLGLSTIGLGNNFNRDLLTELADAGNGTVHLIDNAEGMQRVFVDEFECLLSKAARNIKLKVTWHEGAKLRKVHGYDPKRKKRRITIRPDNMGLGATQVLVCEFDAEQITKVDVQLSFDNCLSGERVQKTASLRIDPKKAKSFSRIASLKKNAVIARLAESLNQTATIKKKSEAEAASSLQNSVAFVREYFPAGKDADVDRIVKLAHPRLEYLEQRQRACKEKDRRKVSFLP